MRSRLFVSHGDFDLEFLHERVAFWILVTNVDGMVSLGSMTPEFSYLHSMRSFWFLRRQPCDNECLHCDGVFHNQGLEKR
jgi:hypothetical protein